jgi:4-hydroxy-tetrahydrodipicolinate synthase
MFTGTYTAIVTPFKDGKVDEPAFERLIKAQIKGGVEGIVPVGTTGESPTLSFKEHMFVIELAVKCAAGRVKVLAGTGGNSTDEAIYLTVAAEKAGADGSLQVAPYYNKPTQEGLFQHYAAISKAVGDLPIVVYSVQGRTGVNVEPATLKRLAAIDNIVGVKEASGSITQIGAVLQQVPDKFDVLSGDDSITLPLMALGGRGLISVAANEIPAEMTQLVSLANKGDFAGARALHRKYLPLMDVNFVESNPIPVKAALALMGLIEPVWRLPLVPPCDAHHVKIAAVLGSLSLLAARSAHAD